MAVGEVDFEDRLKQRIGRPSRVESVAIRFTEDELETLETVAKEKGTTLLNLVQKPLACGQVMTTEEFSGVLANVRTTKRKAATDVMAQYAAAEPKEL
jgi:hypothetical protein